MPTVSFHAPSSVVKRIRAASKKQGVPVSKFLRAAAEQSVERESASFGKWADRFAGVVDVYKRQGPVAPSTPDSSNTERSMQAEHRPSSESESRVTPQREHVSAEFMWRTRCTRDSNALGLKGYKHTAAKRWRISSSISAGLGTVWAISSRRHSLNRARSRCTATFTAPSVVERRPAISA